MLRVVLGALVLLLAASVFLSLRMLRRLPNTVIYFVTSQETSFTLEPAFRHYDADQETQFKAALEDLIRGPTPEEKSKGLSSSLASDTRVLEVRLEGSKVTVNFSKAFTQEDGLANHQGRLYQVLYTLSQSQNIASVVIQIEGQSLRVLGGEGLMIDNPWQRNARNLLPEW
jgi:spore germination protein GerM